MFVLIIETESIQFLSGLWLVEDSDFGDKLPKILYFVFVKIYR